MVAVLKVSRPFDRLGSAPRGGQDYRAEEGQLQIGLYMRHTVLLETGHEAVAKCPVSHRTGLQIQNVRALNQYCINVGAASATLDQH